MMASQESKIIKKKEKKKDDVTKEGRDLLRAIGISPRGRENERGKRRGTETWAWHTLSGSA